MKIEWENIKLKIDDKNIGYIETFFNIKFPNTYIDCIKKYNGGKPIPNIFDLPNGNEESIRNLIDADLKAEWNIISVYKHLSKYLGNVIPFGEDSNGNLICFDYRKGKNLQPQIVFWEHETAAINNDEAFSEICNSFTDFLKMLREYVDE
jgi:hypothetical protein